jgi:hypothetical protein
MSLDTAPDGTASAQLGLPPTLRPPIGRMLHVLNGTATSGTLEQSNVLGTYVAYFDALTDGPVPGGLSDQEMREVRARYVASRGWAEYGEAMETARAWDAALEGFADYDEVVLWFEHDLFDQLLLIRHLDWFARRDLGSTKLTLICIDAFPGVEPFHGLGQLTADQLESLVDTRRPVTTSQTNVARRAWAAFTSPEPTAFAQLLTDDTRALRFLDGAVRRQLQEYPAVSNGLPRTEREILTILETSGPMRPDDLFSAEQRREERVYMGDASFWWRVEALGAGPHPLVSLDVAPRVDHLPDGKVAITPVGRDILAGKKDWIDLAGFDRWLGGVHLKTPGLIWRWSEESGQLQGGQGGNGG